MNILIVTNMFAGANALQPSQGIFVTEQVDALRRLPGIRVDVMVIDGFRSWLGYIYSLPKVLRRVRAVRYDIVHYHFGLTAWSAPLVRLLTRSKIVITLHGSDVFGRALLRRVTRFVVRFADICIAVSDEIEKEIAPLTRRSVTIPCGVNDMLFTPPATEILPRSNKVVVFPSSASRPEKDYPLFVAAIEHLRLIDDSSIVERRIDGLSREKVRDLLQSADALVMTSTREGSPQTIKEAMACGLPIVSVNVGDVSRLLDGVDGCRVVERRDPTLIALALREILSQGRRSQGLTRLAELGYLSADIAERVYVTYREVLGNETKGRKIPQ